MSAVAKVWLSLSMAVNDFLGTTCTIAEAKGRWLLAGTMDANGDLARLVYYSLGVGTVTKFGLLSPEALLTYAVVWTTSFLVTGGTVRFINPKSAELPGPTEAP